MKRTKTRKIIVSIILIAGIVLLLNSNTVFAEINSEYSYVDTVTLGNLNDAFNNSGLLESIAKLFFAIAEFLEWILGTIAKMLTGTSDFPWADKIVFNSVPLLDINFFNPADKSYLGQPDIENLLKNLYSTILAIAVTFFGIAVAITSIKLLISTIASEKAKYKQAIVDWVVGLVMILCIHYFISFVFFLNEQLVIVASKIVKEQLDDADENIAQVDMKALRQKVIDSMGDTKFKGSYKGAPAGTTEIREILEQNLDLLQTYMNLPNGAGTYGLHSLLNKEDWTLIDWNTHISTDEQKQRLALIIAWAAENTPGANITPTEIREIRDKYLYGVQYCWNGFGSIFCGMAIRGVDARRLFSYKKENSNGEWVWPEDLGYKYDEFWKIFNDNTYEAADANSSGIVDFSMGIVNGSYNVSGTELATHTVMVTEWKNTNKSYFFEHRESLGKPLNGKRESILWLTGGYGNFFSGSQLANKYGVSTYYKVKSYAHWYTILSELATLKEVAIRAQNAENDSGFVKGNRIISDLATYFKYNAIETQISKEDAGAVEQTGKIRIESMLMYAVLVGQSLILFISYIKRLFYVLILAMMAPMVVVMDFFQKFGK